MEWSDITERKATTAQKRHLHALKRNGRPIYDHATIESFSLREAADAIDVARRLVGYLAPGECRATTLDEHCDQLIEDIRAGK